MKMSLEQYKEDVGMCCRCSACKFIPMQKIMGSDNSYVCPSIAKYNFHAYSGGGRVNIISAALKSKEGTNYTDKLVDVIYNCQMCGGCDISCKYGMDMEVLEPIYEFRKQAIADGKTNPTLEKVIANLKKTGYMVPATGKRGDWAKGLNIKDASKEKVDVLYFVGCQTSFNKDQWKLAKATAKILDKAGVDFGILGDAETCCGSRAMQMGYEDAFLAQAKKNIAAIKKTGAKLVVTACADGYNALKVMYERFGLNPGFEAMHITEYIAKLIKDKKLKLNKKVNLSVTYHDPCRLGRLGEPWVKWEGKRIPGDRFVFEPQKPYRRGANGVYDPPRDILKAIPGLRFTEMTRIKEYSWCCGAGGGVSESNPEFAAWTAKERVDEAVSTGAEAMVTACPWCEKTFNAALDASGGNLKIYDIVELVEKAI
jgi:Fe-S oxidoreductase